MPEKGSGSGSSASTGQRYRVDVYFGKLTKKIKGNNQTRNYLIKVQKRVQDALNLPLATPEQSVNKEGSKENTVIGCVGAKFVIVPDPTGRKTPKGNPVTHRFPVPGNATIKEIKEFLANTKAEKFSIAGGRSYGVPGKKA